MATNNTQTSQELYQALWNSADILRSKMDANDYKSYLLGLIFYKFLSDKSISSNRFSKVSSSCSIFLKP